MTSGKVNTYLFILVMLFVGQFVTVIELRAQQSNTQAAPTPSPTPSPSPLQPTATPTPPPPPKVVGVEGHLELDVIINVKIDHLAEWDASGDVTKLVPYLDGLALKGNYPVEVHASENHLYFHLKVSPENKEVWADLLGEPNGTRRLVTFSVGLEGPSPFETIYDQDNRLPLTVISPFYGVMALVIVLITLIVFIWLAMKTNIIRESGPNPGAGKLKPYNLGRTQMAIWFFLIYVSYQAIWLVTHSLDTITASLLALMGISAGTALGDVMIDSGKDTARAGQLLDLTAEQQALDQSIVELHARLTSVNEEKRSSPDDLMYLDSLNKQLQDYRVRLNQVTQQLKAITPAAASNVTHGFLQDILSDANGYSFHRFQIFAWTIVLGIIFLSSVYNNLTMPVFSTTLLGLMGISSGTYLGFKFPEKR